MKPIAALLVLLPCCVVVSACGGGAYKIDTVTFVASGSTPPAAGPTPNIHIDTNVKVSGLAGGTVRSRKPYSIGIDYTDETFTFAAAEVTKLTITDAGGVNDPGAAALELPLRIAARPYEAVNSVAGGRIVKTQLRVISGSVPGVITRDKPVTVVLEGRLIKEDGTGVPFAISHEYDVVADKSTKPWREVMQDR
jgi:hypothetical protein